MTARELTGWQTCDSCGGETVTEGWGEDPPAGWEELRDGSHLCLDCAAERDRAVR
jgi:hypothetical protein